MSRDVIERVREALAWEAMVDGFEARVIDQATAAFLATLGEPRCPRCGGTDLYAKGYCKQDYQDVWRKRKVR